MSEVLVTLPTDGAHCGACPHKRLWTLMKECVGLCGLFGGDLFRPATWPEGIEHHRAVLRGHCYAHGLVDCTSMPGDRAEDIDRIGHGESLPARAVYRTFTITRRGRKVVRDETREEPEHRG